MGGSVVLTWVVIVAIGAPLLQLGIVALGIWLMWRDGVL
jgi:hypothetical protein